MRSSNRSLALPAVAAALLLASLLSQAEPSKHRLIVNASNPVRAMAKAEVSRLFLKKSTAWPDGRAALPVDQPERSPVRESFSEGVLHRSVASIKSYWQQRIFSGSDVPPPEMGSDAEVINYVKSHPGAIGYVSEVPAGENGVAVLRTSD